MIQIYVCEDNPQQLRYFTEIIQKYLLMHDFSQKFVFGALNPKDLLEELEKKIPEFGLYFLDICLENDMNGLQSAKKIREKDPLGEIVFVTSKSELCMLTFQYQVRALDFIVKDDMELLPEKILKCIKSAEKVYRQILNKSAKSFSIKQGGERIFLNPDEILYMETSGDASHKIAIYTQTKVYHTYGTIKEFAASFEKYPNFFRCHQSVLVNKNYVQRIDRGRKQIILTNGSICPVSVRYLRTYK